MQTQAIQSNTEESLHWSLNYFVMYFRIAFRELFLLYVHLNCT